MANDIAKSAVEIITACEANSSLILNCDASTELVTATGVAASSREVLYMTPVLPSSRPVKATSAGARASLMALSMPMFFRSALSAAPSAMAPVASSASGEVESEISSSGIRTSSGMVSHDNNMPRSAAQMMGSLWSFPASTGSLVFLLRI